MSVLRHLRGVLAIATCVLPVACGGSSLRLQDVTPESVPALEAANAQRPNDATALTRLGVGYFRANRYGDARATLDSALQLTPQNGIASIYLGMTTEAQGDFTAARAAYEHYLTVGRSRELNRTARQRLALVGRRELEFQARQALAQESTLSQQPPELDAIAVMPFAYTGTNAEIAPLTRGFAQLVVTDLAKSRQVRVLERERMQAMVDEMRLGETQRAEPATAVRSGRMLRAGRVVQGTLSDRETDLRIDAAVVDVTSSGVTATADQTGELARLFDLEKALVLQIFQDLGIQLTDAERSEIEQRPTQNLQAFLAWSRGLEAEDRGDYAGARDLFEQASRLDPSFGAAAQSAQNAGELTAAATQSSADVDAAVSSASNTETQSAPTGQALANGSQGTNPNPLTSTDTETQQNTTPQQNDGQNAVIPPGPALRGTVIIVIRRP